MFYSKSKELSHIELLIYKGKYQEALQELNKLEVKESFTVQDKISSYILKSIVIVNLGDFKNGFKLAEEACRESKKLKDPLYLIDAYIRKAQILYRFGRKDKIYDLIAKSEDLLEGSNQEELKEIKKREAKLAGFKSFIYLDYGEFKNAFENAKYSLKLWQEIGIEQEIARAFFRMGTIYFSALKDWDRMQTYYNKALEFAKKTDYKSLISTCLGRLGDIYMFKGELDAALEYYNQGLEFSKEINNKPGITFCLGGLGYIYELQGDLKRALEYTEKALKIKEEMGDILGILGFLDTAFMISYNNNNYKRAQYYFDQMKRVVDQTDYKIEITCVELDEAMMLKLSPLASDKKRSKEILEKLITKKDFIEVTIRALLNLCDLLLKELYQTDKLELLDEIQPYIIQIQDIAKDLNSFWLLTEVYSFQSRLKLIIFDFKEAQDYLVQAMDIAEKCGLDRLTKQITEQQNELSENVIKWKSLKASGAKISECMDLARIDKQIQILLHKRKYLQTIINRS